MTIKVEPSTTDADWIVVTVDHGEPSPAQVSIDREALKTIMREDPRPPELLLDLLCERVIKRMPLANGPHGARLITAHNLSLVWPK